MLFERQANYTDPTMLGAIHLFHSIVNLLNHQNHRNLDTKILSNRMQLVRILLRVLAWFDAFIPRLQYGNSYQNRCRIKAELVTIGESSLYGDDKGCTACPLDSVSAIPIYHRTYRNM